MKAADLKNSILQLAISGRLVPQDPADEPASVLYEQIQAEKNRLIKEGKIKASKKNDCINLPEPPFEIPESWMWVKLGDVADLYTGDSISEIVKATKYKNLEIGYDYIGTKDVGFDNVITYNNGVKIPYDEKGFKYAYDTSILLCIEGGSAGRKIARLDKKVCFGNKLCSITPFGFENSFLYYFLQSDFFRSTFNEKNSGIIGGVSITKLFELAVPLPPLGEQKRIVEKIEELEPLVNRYGKAAEELARLKSTFPDELRNSILQEAVSGHLVPQNPADEPASVLYEQIQAAKNRLIKDGKVKPSKLPKLNEPLNPPFKIPNSWMWTSLSAIGLINPRNIVDNDLEVSFIPMNKISSIYNIPVNVREKRAWKNVKSYTHLKDGDVIMAKITPCFENKKSAVLCNLVNGYGAGTTELHVFRNITNINPKYVLIYLKSPDFMQYASNNMTGTAGQQRVSSEIFANYPFPLPPINEQQRIVNKVDELMDLSHQFEQIINQAV
ncbi:MAG: restriction endonuclease subunit S [Alphaproteobacteria bacterium]|nr:restriction endonuclease subunit S [Alphaproteobacteria bacterium]